MRILQLCNRVPYPPKDGGAIAMLNVTTELHRQGHEVHLLCLNTRKHYIQPEKLPSLFHQLASFQAIGIDTDIKASDAFRNLFKKESYHIVRFYSTVFEQELIKTLKQHNFGPYTWIRSGKTAMPRSYSAPITWNT
jgi:polysaccharide biosynthesis protein PslH